MYSRLRLKDQPIFWDSIIALLVLGGFGAAALCIWLVISLTRNPTLEIVLGAIGTLATLGSLTVLYGSFLEPKLINVNKKVIHIDGLPKLRIAVASDMHLGPYKSEAFAHRLVARLNALNPDVIFLVGDFLFDHRYGPEPLAPFQDLRSPHGVYAVLGNHDSGFHCYRGTMFHFPERGDEVATMLDSLGITMLRNSHKILTIDKQTFAIAGIDDIWMPSCDIDATLHGIPADVPAILLAHDPDVILRTGHERADLIVSGHTHGGQIRLPFIGAVPALPNQLGKQFDQGIFQLKSGTTLAITHGCGESGVRARLWCMPEILVLENA